MNRTDLNKKRKLLEEQLAAVQADLDELNTSGEDIQLAEGLHDIQCHSDHTEMCDWFYGQWTDPVLRSSRLRYLDKAQKISTELEDTWMLDYSVEEILDLVRLLR